MDGLRRPNVVTFAGVVLIAAAGFHALYAISELTDTLWALDNVGGIAAENDLWVWGVVDGVIAVALLVAGIMLLNGGGAFAVVVGGVWAAIDAVRYLYWIPAHPLLSVTMVVIDLVVIYALFAYPIWTMGGAKKARSTTRRSTARRTTTRRRTAS